MLKRLALIFFGLLQGCSEPLDLQESLSASQPPRLPVVTSLSYSAQSSASSIPAPFSESILVYPDFQTGICSAVTNTAELTLEGTYDERRTKSIEAVGLTTQSFELNNGRFTLRFCAALGSSAVRIVAVSESNKRSDEILFSFNLTPSLATIGFGLAKYPNPGFLMESIASSPESLASGSLTAEAFNLSSIHTSEKSATVGSAQWNLSIGFVSVLKEAQP